ncbi:MAG: hypothetical protein KAF91_24660 [Nostoc sp. TH1S01]|nr:hypothetical protein [Nostoc sp. TH1S01]
MQETLDNQWIKKDTYYQILVVSPIKKEEKEEKKLKIRPHIQTKIVVRRKEEFESDYPLYLPKQDGNEKNVGSNLPSSGVELTEKFLDKLIEPNKKRDEVIKIVNNFYDSSRNLLQLRKISQLIAQTWYSFLKAQKPQTGEITAWQNFVNGEWGKIDSEILNGLISREIFFIDQSYYPSSLDPENLEMYYPLYGLTKKIKDQVGKDQEITRFLILPNSLAWQRITLSLLIAGQAYREICVDGTKYYQRIWEPILSTGEIVNNFALDVDWCAYVGKFKEVQLSSVRFSSYYQVCIPYPPIPSENNLSCEEIKSWAIAPDEGGDFPFYGSGGEYTDIKYASPPFPYLPLSTT